MAYDMLLLHWGHCPQCAGVLSLVALVFLLHHKGNNAGATMAKAPAQQQQWRHHNIGKKASATTATAPLQ
jgi:hypothetical protein